MTAQLASEQLAAEFPHWDIAAALQGRIVTAARHWDGGRRRRYIVAGSAQELLEKMHERIAEEDR